MKIAIDQIAGEKNGLETNISLVVPGKEEMIKRAARNIKNLQLISVEKLNAYEVLNTGRVIMTKKALESIEQRFEKKHKKIEKDDKEKKEKRVENNLKKGKPKRVNKIK